MAYTYSPPMTPADDENDEKLKGVSDSEAQEQPAATVPDPANDGDPYRRNLTAVPGNIETRYGAVASPVGQPPTNAATPDAFAPTSPAIVARNLLVPSTAPAEVPPPAAPPANQVTQSLAAQIAPRVPQSPLVTGAAAAGMSATSGVPTSVAPAVTPTVAGAANVPPPPVTPPGQIAPTIGRAANATPFPGTLPGTQPQANGQPVTPRPITEDEDAYRRRLAVA